MEKKVGKIIIDYYDIDPALAIQRVLGVVQGGKISRSGKGIDHYCWASRYNTGEVVGVRTKRNEKAADSFVVYKEINTP